MSEIAYGTVTTEDVYREGSVVHTVRSVSEIRKIVSRKEVLDTIFDQLNQLKEYDSICFTIYADKRTREPVRIELTAKTQV